MNTQEFRNVLGSFVTGVTVITAVDEAGYRLGVTVNSFTSLSLDPPLILWCQSLAAASHARFRTVKRFNVNVLSAEQLDISRRFAGGSGPKFDAVECDFAMNGSPLIKGAVAYLECTMHAQIPGGDHMIFVGKVEKVSRTPRPPLLFGMGRYLLAHPHYSGSAIAEDQGERHARRVVQPWIEDSGP